MRWPIRTAKKVDDRVHPRKLLLVTEFEAAGKLLTMRIALSTLGLPRIVEANLRGAMASSISAQEKFSYFSMSRAQSDRVTGLKDLVWAPDDQAIDSPFCDRTSGLGAFDFGRIPIRFYLDHSPLWFLTYLCQLNNALYAPFTRPRMISGLYPACLTEICSRPSN
jgi:hypothetical protein